jgi:hypothetical protein
MAKKTGIDYPTIGLAVVAVVAVVAQGPSFLRQQQMKARVNEAGAIAQESTYSAQLQREQAESQAEVANARYDLGGEMVFATGSNSAAAIQEGQPVIAGAYQHLYKAGTKVDQVNPSHYVGGGITLLGAYGETAVTEFDPKLGYAVARKMAVTPDRDRINKAIARYKGATRPSLVKP